MNKYYNKQFFINPVKRLTLLQGTEKQSWIE